MVAVEVDGYFSFRTGGPLAGKGPRRLQDPLVLGAITGSVRFYRRLCLELEREVPRTRETAS